MIQFSFSKLKDRLDIVSHMLNFDTDPKDPLGLGSDYIDGIKRYDEAMELMKTQASKMLDNPLFNGIIFQGSPGIGKTHALKDLIYNRIQKDPNFKYATLEKATHTGMYAAGFKCRHGGLCIFDDCDSAFEESNTANTLKHLTDTYNERKMSSVTSIPMLEDTDIDEAFDEYKDDPRSIDALNKGYCPRYYTFTGKCIVLTNKNLSQLNTNPHAKALISRMDPYTINVSNIDKVYKSIDILLNNPEYQINEKLKEYSVILARYIAEHVNTFAIDEYDLRKQRIWLANLYNFDGDINRLDKALHMKDYLNWKD